MGTGTDSDAVASALSTDIIPPVSSRHRTDDDQPYQFRGKRKGDAGWCSGDNNRISSGETAGGAAARRGNRGAMIARLMMTREEGLSMWRGALLEEIGLRIATGRAGERSRPLRYTEADRPGRSVPLCATRCFLHNWLRIYDVMRPLHLWLVFTECSCSHGEGERYSQPKQVQVYGTLFVSN